jgi:RHS repeat-associated protein
LKHRHSWLSQAAAAVLVPAQVLLAVPVAAEAAAPREKAKVEAPRVVVNGTSPRPSAVALRPGFSLVPTDQQIFRARVFDEPLVPTAGEMDVAENRRLGEALLAYLEKGADDASSIEAFLAERPSSRWAAALWTGLGIVYRRTGYYSRALMAWERAWALSKDQTEPRPRAIGDRAVAELAELNARLGRFDRLEKIFAEIEGRDVRGAAAEKISGARTGYWSMLHTPEKAFRCGPMALDRILAATRKSSYAMDPRIYDARSTQRGTSLAEMRDLARDVGLSMQMARRQSPEAEVLAPAMVHWKAGHYAALLRLENGRYLVQDPTFGDETWITPDALNEESSGFFLVPTGTLPPGWSALSDEDGGQVWGKGQTTMNNPPNYKPEDPKVPDCEDPPPPMAVYGIHLMLVSLNLSDTPVGYSPPVGPAVRFTVRYNQREVFQPQIPYYGNFGPKWTYDWLTYVEDNPSNLTASVNVYIRGGGQETSSGYNASTQSYAPHMESRAVVVRTSTSPIRYERRLPDGSVEVFAQPDGGMNFPRRVFMTSWRDAQGNTVQLTYDQYLRLVAITDAIGQITTLSYDDPVDNPKITRVTDPFGRSATFEYNASGQLSRITDVIGIESSFTYRAGDVVSSLTTPYGTTTFSTGESGTTRWVDVTDPLGGKERVEFRHDAPGIAGSDPTNTIPAGMPVPITNQFLQYRNTFYWDKRASALFPGDYTKARLWHWLHTTDVNVASGVIESTKNPLENRAWYAYPGQTSSAFVGTSDKPRAIGRVLDDGNTQLYRYEYNSNGKPTKIIDPAGRETVFEYDTNDIDLLRIKEKNGAAYELLGSFTYNSQHLPLTATDAAGQRTDFTYNAQGQPLTVTTPQRAGVTENRTTTYAYDTNGYLQSVTGPIAGATGSFTYDGYGRVRTVTESQGYVLVYDYDTLDRLTKVTFPDTTYQEIVYNRLDAEKTRDRLGRWAHVFYDALRRPVSIRDTAGRTTAMQWCTCGSMDKIIDPNNHATSWERDLQGRITKETRADSSTRQYTYETTTSRLKKVKDAKTQEIQYSYLLDNTLQQISHLNAQVATPNITFAYDPIFPRLSSMVDGTGTTTVTYHAIGATPGLGAGRLATVDGPQANDTVSYEYDELSRVVSRSLNGVMTTWAYDALGRLTSQGDPVGGFSFGYVGPTGRLQNLTYPNAQTSTYTYLPNVNDQRLQEIHHRTSGGVTLSRFTHGFDTVGNLKTWTQQYGAAAVNAFDLAYDPADQISSAIYRTTDPTPMVLKRYAYAYDPASNRTTEQIDDAPVASTYSDMNRLTSQDGGGALAFRGTVTEAATVSVQGKPAMVTADNRFEGRPDVTPGANSVAVVATDASGNTRTNTYQVSVASGAKTFGYDANGNLITNGTKTYEWDAQNQLTRILDGGSEVARFTYDGFGRRAQKVSGGVTRTFIYGGEDVLEERLSTGGVVRYIHGPGTDQPLGAVDPAGAVSYYVADHLGSIVQATDSTGNVTITRQYDVYGNLLTGATISGYAFTGREWDAETGLYYYRARYYDPKLGRFISEDPARLALARFNAYGYAANSPTGWIDPTGLAPAGHHYVPNIVRGMPGLSPAAKSVFDGATTGPLDTPNLNQGYSTEHRAYDPAVRRLFDEYTKGSGIDPGKMTADQARGFIQQVRQSKDAAIRPFIENVEAAAARRAAAEGAKGMGKGMRGIGRGLGALCWILVFIDAIQYAIEVEECEKDPCSCGSPDCVV